MERIIVQAGGRPDVWEDDLTLQQQFEQGFERLFEELPPCVISGCIADTANGNISEGLVWINNKVCRFYGASGVDFGQPVYLVYQETPFDSREYADSISRNCRLRTEAVVSTISAPGAIQLDAAAYDFPRLDLIVKNPLSQKIKDQVSSLQTSVGTLQTDVGSLQSNVSTLQTDVSNLQSDVSTLQTDVNNLQSDVSTVQSTASNANVRIDSHEARLWMGGQTASTINVSFLNRVYVAFRYEGSSSTLNININDLWGSATYLLFVINSKSVPITVNFNPPTGFNPPTLMYIDDTIPANKSALYSIVKDTPTLLISKVVKR